MQAIVVIVSFVIGTFIGYAVLLRLPGIEKNNRKIKINLTLHNAVAYMYAMRRGGAQMMTIFRSLSDRANIYGEVALEFRQIVRDADFFGYDVVSAIRHLSETTPSEKLKDFLEDLLSVIESGGDMAEFLSMRVRLYQEEARFEQRQFLNVLSIVAESYVTLFVAGPLFLIIIMVVMGMMGGSAVLQLALVTYASCRSVRWFSSCSSISYRSRPKRLNAMSGPSGSIPIPMSPLSKKRMRNHCLNN